MRRSASLYPIVMLIAVLVAVLVITDFKDDSLLLEQQRYCRMVALHNDNPDIGWPDFHGTFASECNEDGTVKSEN